MSGKTLVIFLLAVSGVFAAVAFWFLFSLTPADQRFNQQRNAVPPGTTLTEMLPDMLDDFSRLTPPVAPQAAEVAATYGNENFRVNITIKPLNSQDPQQEIKDNLTEPSCKVPGDDPSTTTHLDGKVAFIYTECASDALIGGGDSTYIFTWLDDNYLFSADAGDPEGLLRFVNAYPH